MLTIIANRNLSSNPLSFDSAEIASTIPSSSSREGLGTPEYPRASQETLIIISFASHLAKNTSVIVTPVDGNSTVTKLTC
jgi:hypothetical protein